MAAKAIAPSSLLAVGTSVKNFSARPLEIQAIQFRDWSSAMDIFTFAEGFMFVPRGYEHKYRQTTEWDQTSGNVNPDAPEFLVFKTEQGEYRIDLGLWVLKKANGDISVLPDEQFNAIYQENSF